MPKANIISFFILVNVLFFCFAQAKESPARAKLETCGGWRLNSLPHVKAFIQEHADLYSKFEVDYIGGADPELVFLDKDSKELERIPVDELVTEDICKELEKRGFKKDKSAEVPDPPAVYDEL